MVGGDDNYSHWLFRNMLKLSRCDTPACCNGYPWLATGDLRGYQLDYIRLLGTTATNDQRVERNAVIHCSRVLAPALHVSTRAHHAGRAWLRNAGASAVAPAQATRQLFLSRRTTAAAGC